jgi:quercetin dioxygenase-like cupin family protein
MAAPGHGMGRRARIPGRPVEPPPLRFVPRYYEIEQALRARIADLKPDSPLPSDAIHLGPITVTFSVEAEDSNGTATVARIDVEAGAGIPLAHFHDAFEETIYGLTGTTVFTIDGERVVIGPGDTFCITRGCVHSFVAAGDDDASFLAIATPGVFGAAYFREIAGAMAANGGVPDMTAFAAIMRRHGLTPVPA